MLCIREIWKYTGDYFISSFYIHWNSRKKLKLYFVGDISFKRWDEKSMFFLLSYEQSPPEFGRMQLTTQYFWTFSYDTNLQNFNVCQNSSQFSLFVKRIKKHFSIKKLLWDNSVIVGIIFSFHGNDNLEIWGMSNEIFIFILFFQSSLYFLHQLFVWITFTLLVISHHLKRGYCIGYCFWSVCYSKLCNK